MGDSWRDEIKARQKNLSALARFRANSPESGSQDRENQIREQVKHKVFSARKRAPSKAQLRMWIDA